MGLIKYMLDSDSRKSLKKLNKMALRVESLEPKYQAMTDDELRAQTQVLKDRLAKGETLDDILYDAFAARHAKASVPRKSLAAPSTGPRRATTAVAMLVV